MSNFAGTKPVSKVATCSTSKTNGVFGVEYIHFQSDAKGVAQRLTCCASGGAPWAFFPLTAGAVAVGVDQSDNEQSLSPVWGSDVRGLDSGGFHRVTFGMEPGDNDVQPSTLESGNVFDDNPSRAQLSDDSEKLVPQAASGAG
jgi:hypothetical protein